MKTKLIFKSLLLFVFAFGVSSLHAQQTPKKVSAKKTTKPAVKKKTAAKKSGDVFIWDGTYFYHKNSGCPELKKSNKQNRKIFSVPVTEAKGQFSAKPCKKCF